MEEPDRNLRICLHPRHLNKAIKRERFQLPIIEDSTTHMANAFWLLWGLQRKLKRTRLKIQQNTRKTKEAGIQTRGILLSLKTFSYFHCFKGEKHFSKIVRGCTKFLAVVLYKKSGLCLDVCEGECRILFLTAYGRMLHSSTKAIAKWVCMLMTRMKFCVRKGMGITKFPL